IEQAYEELIKAAERDPKFNKRVAESVRRVLAFKKKSAKLLRRKAAPSSATVEKLSRKLWEFGEQARLEALNRLENERSKNARRPRA
ncbi:MAG: hypothetical protein WCA19_04640, partial [Candidatus Acidiferrales bacterium]